MSTPQLEVFMIRAFEGPRHERLRQLWDCVAEYQKRDWRLCRLPNPGAGLNHAAALEQLWDLARKSPARYVILTEEDFLPDWENFANTAVLTEKRPIFAAEYCTRDAASLVLRKHRIPTPWYLLVDKEHIQELNFAPAGRFNDPGNGLADYVKQRYGKELMLYTSVDAMPEHYGVRIVAGEHLYWSRHYNDPPGGRPAGFPLDDILARHDAAVTKYIARAPLSFQRLYQKRTAPCLAQPSA